MNFHLLASSSGLVTPTARAPLKNVTRNSPRLSFRQWPSTMEQPNLLPDRYGSQARALPRAPRHWRFPPTPHALPPQLPAPTPAAPARSATGLVRAISGTYTQSPFSRAQHGHQRIPCNRIRIIRDHRRARTMPAALASRAELQHHLAQRAEMGRARVARQYDLRAAASSNLHLRDRMTAIVRHRDPRTVRSPADLHPALLPIGNNSLHESRGSL